MILEVAFFLLGVLVGTVVGGYLITLRQERQLRVIEKLALGGGPE